MEHRKVSQAEYDYQLIGSKRIAPGIWQDAEGHVHFSILELMQMVGLEDTPENREAVFEIVRQSAEEHGIAGQLIRQDPK